MAMSFPFQSTAPGLGSSLGIINSSKLLAPECPGAINKANRETLDMQCVKDWRLEMDNIAMA